MLNVQYGIYRNRYRDHIGARGVNGHRHKA